jgi:hypothetical protein
MSRNIFYIIGVIVVIVIVLKLLGLSRSSPRLATKALTSLDGESTIPTRALFCVYVRAVAQAKKL